QALFADPDAAATVDRLRGLGVEDAVVTDGANGCVLLDGDGTLRLPAEHVPTVDDSTAAGDAFNAAYLAARLTGTAPPDSAQHAQKIAATVICHPGAIVADEVLPKRA
ncbi:MAG: hypothetical protein IJH84_02555, partial [Saccharopolyspora sp.]|uniref:carbohydrate kinase family protein n=1 Tax=Saccharopolyspora sp. TaxID=33915 RepID=UPI0026000C83